MKCPLCSQSNADFFHFDQFRTYFRCTNCLLIFVEPNQFPTPDQEKARYLLHRNEPTDEGYIRFLNSFIHPLQKKISKSARGLDYGSGPNPVLAKLLEKDGYQISTFDPFFDNNTKALQKTYDYLTCVETVEHFHHPGQDWETMIKLVNPDGWLGIKTSMYQKQINFSSWHYKRDITHVCFYSIETFDWIGRVYDLTPQIEDDSTIFFRFGP